MLSPKDFYAGLYSAQDFNSKINTTILYGRLSDLATDIAGKDDKVVVFCVEGDFVYGKKAETLLKPSLKNLSLAVACEKDLSAETVYALIGQTDVLVAVGEEPTVNACKGAAFLRGAKLVSIYTSCKMSEALSPCVTFKKCGETVEAKKYADILAVVPEFCSSPKKQYLVETFGETVSALTDIIDYKVAVAKKEAVYDKAAISTLYAAVERVLSPKNFSDLYTNFALAAINLSAVKEYSNALDFSAADKIADFLSGSAPYGEKKYRAFLVLINIYKLYLTEFSSSLTTLPDAVRASKLVSDHLRIKEYDVLAKFSPSLFQNFTLKDEQLKKILLSTLKRDAVLISQKTEYFEKLYASLYNGKRKLSQFSKSDLRVAVKAAAYSSENNLLSLAKDDGFANFI